MKYVKILSLLAVAAAALMAFAASASATTVTSSTGTTPTIESSAEGHAVLDNPIAKIECVSTVKGKVETHGTGVTAGGAIETLTFGSPVGTCTNSWHVTVVSAGSLEIHATSGGNGTLTSSGATVEATRFGVTCRYATSSTDIGTVTAGEHATLHITASIPFHSGSFLCGEGATTWTGAYKVSSPTNLSVDS